MNFRRLILTLALGFAVVSTAGAVTIGYNPRSGDVWVDTQLGDINRYGNDQHDYFVDDLVGQYGAPRGLVNDLLGARHWQPGDVYYACALAYQTHQRCGDVADQYEQNRGQGWGVIAQRMGIKPGSREFFALKDGLGRAHGRFHAHGNAHGNNGKGNNGKGNNGQGHGKDKGNGHNNGHGNNGGGHD